MLNQQLKYADSSLVGYMKIIKKKPESVPFFVHEQIYIKGTLFFKKQTKVSVPYLKLSVFHGSSILASCGALVGKMHLWSRAKK